MKNLENSTLKNNPECMTVICNIQAMRQRTVKNYDQFKDFKNLQNLTFNQLYEIQNSLINEYNKTVV